MRIPHHYTLNNQKSHVLFLQELQKFAKNQPQISIVVSILRLYSLFHLLNLQTNYYKLLRNINRTE